MQYSELDSALKVLGLSNFETQLYYLLYDQDTTNISSLAVQLDTYRSKIYSSVEKIKSIGLLVKNENGSYRSAPPSRITILLKEHSKKTNELISDVNQALPYFNAKYRFQKEYSNNLLDTKESIGQTLYSAELQHHSTIYHYCESSQWYDFFDHSDLFENYFKKIVNFKARLRVVTFKDNLHIQQYTRSALLHIETKHLPHSFRSGSSTLILPYEVMIFNTDQSLVYHIVDPEVVKTYFDQVDFMWKLIQ